MNNPKHLTVVIFNFCIIEELNIAPCYVQNLRLVSIVVGNQIDL